MTVTNHAAATAGSVTRFMKSTRLWPERYPSKYYNLQNKLAWFVLCTFAVNVLFQCIYDLKSIDYILFDVAAFLATTNCITKHLVLVINKETLFQTLEWLDDPMFVPYSVTTDKQISRKFRECRILYAIFLIFGQLIIALGVLIPLAISVSSGNLSLPIPCSIDANKMNKVVYIGWCALQVAGGILVSYALPSVDVLILVFMVGVLSQLQNLQDKISVDEQGMVQKYYQKDVFPNWVEHHLRIERYFQGVADIVTYGMLLQLLLSVILVCITGFSVIVVPVFSFQCGRAIFLFITGMLELAMFCVPANEIILQSLKIREACYFSHWTEAKTPMRKSLFIMMERSKRPFSLTAGKFVVLSLPTFLTVVRSAFSYFMVLIHFYKDSNVTR